jgi:DUF4097 and DUF4098 domain-containing protein YvlB
MIALPLILVLLLLCGGMLWLGYYAVQGLASADGLYIFNWKVQNTPAEAEESHTYPAAAVLDINNACGDIHVTGGSGSEIALTMHKQAWGSNAAEAQAALDKIQLDVKEENGQLIVGLKDADTLCNGRQMRPPTITLTFQVPEKTKVDAGTQFGDVSLEGLLANASLHSQFGGLQARHITGELSANSRNGRLVIEDVQAGEGDISLNSNFGDIDLRQSTARHVKIQAGNGQVTLSDVTASGEVTLSGDFGQQVWHGGSAQSLESTTKNGRIDLQDLEVSGGVKVESNFGDIALKNVTAAQYGITTRNGRIDVDGATGDVTAQSDFGDITVSATQPIAINLTSQNGAISYTGALNDQASQAHTRFGNVRLALPAGSAFNFDLQTNFGKISSDFEVQINGTPNETHWQGQVAGGGATLTVETQNGNIQITKEGE